MDELNRLLQMLEDSSHEVRMEAVRGLGELGGERARFKLTEVVKDRWGQRPEVRLAALGALDNFYETDRYASFLEEFTTGDNRKVVAGARRILSEVDPASYPARLASRGCLDHSAIGVYGRSREPSAVPLIGGFLEEKMEAGELAGARDWGKVFAAVKALGYIGGDEAGRILRAVLEWTRRAEGSTGAFLEAERIVKIRDAARRSLELPGEV